MDKNTPRKPSRYVSPFDLFIESVKEYAIFSIDVQGNIDAWNSGAGRMFGYIESEIIGEHYRILFLSEDRQTGVPEEEMTTAKAVGRASSTRWHIRKDGSMFWGIGTNHLIHDEDGNIRGFYHICRNLTEHHNAEEALCWIGSHTDIDDLKRYQERLQESEERFRVTFDQAAVGMAHVALDGRWLRVNQRLAEKVGYTCEELLTQKFQDITHPDDLDTDLEYIRQLIAGDLQTYAMEKRYIRKDGSITWVMLTVSLVRDETGNPLYFISVVEDINQRKASEEALGRYHIYIEELNKQLQGSMAETHHRVKNNLQHIAAFVSLRLDTDNLSEREANELRRLNSLVLALAAIHDLLTQQAKDYGQTQDISSREFLERLLLLLEQAAGGRTIRHKVQPYRVTTRQAATLAVILNELVANALKHSAGDIEVSFMVDAQMGELQVCDRGPGFPPDFNPVLQANTGLELVETLTRTDLGGQVLYRNREGGGACVLVSLPLDRKDYA